MYWLNTINKLLYACYKVELNFRNIIVGILYANYFYDLFKYLHGIEALTCSEGPHDHELIHYHELRVI